MSKLASVEVFRFDPEVDASPRYETYNVPYEGMSVLDVLRYIYEHHDPSLSFRFGCNVGMCYGCLLMVDGVSILSCRKAAEEKMRISPITKFELIKDLVVDYNKPKQREKTEGNKD